MFSNTEIDDLNTMLPLYERYLRDGPQEEALPDLPNELLEQLTAEDNVKPLPPPLPDYALNSILYRSPTQWALWINGDKMTSRDAKRDNMEILNVSASYARIAIKIPQLKQVIPDWRDKARMDNRVTVIPDEERVVVTLSPNQVLIPEALEVLEGGNIQKDSEGENTSDS